MKTPIFFQSLRRRITAISPANRILGGLCAASLLVVTLFIVAGIRERSSHGARQAVERLLVDLRDGREEARLVRGEGLVAPTEWQIRDVIKMTDQPGYRGWRVVAHVSSSGAQGSPIQGLWSFFMVRAHRDGEWIPVRILPGPGNHVDEDLFLMAVDVWVKDPYSHPLRSRR